QKALREAVTQTVENAVGNFVKKTISDFIKGILDARQKKADAAEKAAELARLQKASDDQKAATISFANSSATVYQAMQDFGIWVQQFVTGLENAEQVGLFNDGAGGVGAAGEPGTPGTGTGGEIHWAQA